MMCLTGKSKAKVVGGADKWQFLTNFGDIFSFFYPVFCTPSGASSYLSVVGIKGNLYYCYVSSTDRPKSHRT